MTAKNNSHKMKDEVVIDPVKKLIHITLEGYPDLAETQRGTNELEKNVNLMPDVAEWAIIVDSTALSTFSPDLLPILKHCYKAIYERFRVAVIVNPTQTVANMQLKRIARETNFSGKFVATNEEAMKVCFG
ncbi:hypothetical protein DCC85_04030 [Paenibacillus sp. CAA11]|uniref:hypothetical protein n=1 Tax=Paenibacillus sp. CAA11 TaxID=1532905 RepID=UPI000D3B0937|nr:hypothetical protein [Paenibacillus sp. CAA11]AWB43472.1 hypothetical protein DCC85_04030 [Paenibacillus sp. CAA11]